MFPKLLLTALGLVAGILAAERASAQQYHPQAVTYQHSIADPMPQPNYHWIHGKRYTPTAFLQLAQWYRRQTHLSPGEQEYWIRFWQEQNDLDQKREQDWIKSTFGNPYR